MWRTRSRPAYDWQAEFGRDRQEAIILRQSLGLRDRAVLELVAGPADDEADPEIRVTVVTTIYDAEGSVMGYRQETVGEGETLAPGASWEFDVLLTPQRLDPPSSFRVLSWAVLAGG